MAWTISENELIRMQEHCISGFPLESCGLFIGPIDADGSPTGEITSIWPANNVEQSARIYSVDPKAMFEANRFAYENSCEIVGVYHSHTHTQAFPSPTDIAKAVDPNWCYAIVSLAQEEVDVKYFLIAGEEVAEIDCYQV